MNRKPEMRTEIKLAGFGGQGIVMGGYLLGKAVTLFSDKFATMTQSYGPESRGGACSSLVMIAEHVGAYPAQTQLDYFVVLSLEAANTYAPQVGRDTIVLYDRDMVPWKRKANSIGIPSVAMAEALGNKLAANMIMLGALCRFLEPRNCGISRATLEKAVRDTMKKSIIEMNLKALAQGFAYEAPEDETARLLEMAFKGNSPG